MSNNDVSNAEREIARKYSDIMHDLTITNDQKLEELEDLITEAIDNLPQGHATIGDLSRERDRLRGK